MDIKLIAITALLAGLLSGCISNGDVSKPKPSTASQTLSTDFESCLANGGDILESYPRSCVIDGRSFGEIIAEKKPLETRTMVMTVGPKTVACQGFHPVNQQCLIVNGEYFYEDIEGFEHQPGVTSTIEVERRQICDPNVFNDCPQDVGIYRYRFLKALTQEGAAGANTIDKEREVSASISTFIGEVVNVKTEKDGFTVTLKLQGSQNVLNAVISPANLGQQSDFDFADIVLGKWLKVTGEPFKLGDQMQMAARSAMSFQKVAIADIKATSQERKACLAVGGEIRQVGKRQADRCVQTYPDAGNSCKDGQDCFGRCLASDEDAHRLSRGDLATGSCAVINNRFGCQAMVEDGRFSGTLCID